MNILLGNSICKNDICIRIQTVLVLVLVLGELKIVIGIEVFGLHNGFVRLPDMSCFNKWADNIVSKNELPLMDLDTYRYLEAARIDTYLNADSWALIKF